MPAGKEDSIERSEVVTSTATPEARVLVRGYEGFPRWNRAHRRKRGRMQFMGYALTFLGAALVLAAIAYALG